MHISAKGEYAVRALLEIAARSDYVSVDEIVAVQRLPKAFVASILLDLRRCELVRARRGNGGYLLSRPADQISVGEILRAVDGPITLVRGMPPTELHYTGASQHLGSVWAQIADHLGDLLERVSLAGVLAGSAPAPA